MTPLEQVADRLRPIVEEYGYLSTIDALALAADRQAELANKADTAYLTRVSDALTAAVKAILEPEIAALDDQIDDIVAEACKHERRTGTGSTREDGSGHMEWSCPDCGKHERMDFPAKEPNQ